MYLGRGQFSLLSTEPVVIFVIKCHSLHQASPCYSLKWASDPHSDRKKKYSQALLERLTDP